jgi:hypothetical protein
VSLTERDAPIKQHFSTAEVQYVGSTSGCGCDFPFVNLQKGQWPIFDLGNDAEREVSNRNNREALVDLLRESGEKTIELYGVWDGDFVAAPKAREEVSLERILDSGFHFKEQGFYIVRLEEGQRLRS